MKKLIFIALTGLMLTGCVEVKCSIPAGDNSCKVYEQMGYDIVCPDDKRGCYVVYEE